MAPEARPGARENTTDRTAILAADMHFCTLQADLPPCGATDINGRKLGGPPRTGRDGGVKASAGQHTAVRARSATRLAPIDAARRNFQAACSQRTGATGLQHSERQTVDFRRALSTKGRAGLHTPTVSCSHRRSGQTRRQANRRAPRRGVISSPAEDVLHAGFCQMLARGSNRARIAIS